jgi:hypothetical protein
MTTKYGFSDIRDQLVKDLKGAYPTRWEDFQTAKILGEDIFGSPKPHPNAVLNLFEAQNVRFAIPFAAYRASIGGFSALMSDKSGTVLPRHTLATTIHGMHVIRSLASHAARVVTYGGDLGECCDERCALNIEINYTREWMEALEKVYDSLVDEREGGTLSSPSLEHLLCVRCARYIKTVHTTWGSVCWENLAPAFAVSRSWDDL